MIDLKEAIETVSIQQSIDMDKIIEVIKDLMVEEFSEFLNAFEEDIIVEVDDQCKIFVFIAKEVVNTTEDPLIEISLTEAKKIEKTTKLNDKINIPIDFNQLKRRDIKHLENSLKYKIRNIRNEILYRDYKGKEGELINGVYLRKQGRDMFIDIGQVEACLSYWDQSPREKYKQGDRIKAYVKEVVLDERNRLNIYVSRTHTDMVKKLFELEVPELADGTIKIREIVRDPGKKTKMSVYSLKEDVEPVGACVGVSGVRIKTVIKELWGERVDVIPSTDNVKEFISRAMQPAKVINTLIIDEAKKECLVVVEDETYPQALGREGSNIKLASKLTEWNISVRTQSQVKKHPEIMNIFSKAEQLFSDIDTDLNQLTALNEALIVKLMNAGIMSVADLYEKTEEEISRLENISATEAKLIRKTLDEMVELVDDDAESVESQKQYMEEVEDQIEGVTLENEPLTEEVEQVEYLVCPSCNYEFEYQDQKQCPSCKVEFEFEEEDSNE